MKTSRALLLGSDMMLRSALWALALYLLQAGLQLPWLRLPFLPLTTIGVAVAFYLGFKNNAAYDRFWEGRKIWGAVVNVSRTWANAVLCYVRPGEDDAAAIDLRRSLIYRHLAWTNALRLQLRRTSRFFDRPARGTRRRLEAHAVHMRNDWDAELTPFLAAQELAGLTDKLNAATHLVAQQGTVLATELRGGKLDKFHQIDMMGLLRELYSLQGKCERIKHTPFPRQYAEFGGIFVRTFIVLVPFGLLDVFGSKLGAPLTWPLNPDMLFLLPYLASTALIGWVFLMMERIGDASEDPFERSFNDVPMNALCRTIERDLRQMLGEDDVPDAEVPIGGVLY